MSPVSLNMPSTLRQYGMKFLILLAIAFILFVAQFVAQHLPVAFAQSGFLTNGTLVSGAITDQTKIIIYSYAGTPGDLVTAQVMGINPEMNPTISLLSPAQQQLIVNDNDPFSIHNTNDARITFILRERGTYSFLVGGTNGEFILRFHVQKPTAARPLRINTPTEVTLQSGVATTLTFTPDPVNPVNLSLISTTAGFTFTARIFDTSGQLVALLGNASIQGASFIIGPQNTASGAANTNYQIVIMPLITGTQGKVSVLLGAVAAPVASNATNQPTIQPTIQPTQTRPQPTVTSTITPTRTRQPSVTPSYTPSITPTVENPNAPKGVCSATPNTNNPVNIRSGPGISYGILGLLQPGQYIVVAGRSVDSEWYINLEGNKQSWVAAQVVTLNGPCDTLDIIAAPPPPSATFTASPPGLPGTPSLTATTKILVLPKTTSTPTLSRTATRTANP